MRQDELSNQGVQGEAIHSLAGGEDKDGGAGVQAVPRSQQC